MAPTLLARHVDVLCPCCSFPFAAGLEGTASDRRPAICPNCGAADAQVSDRDALGGDSVLVDKAAFAWRQPRRWEIVSLRAPHDAAMVCAKRVVGLPGEEISIINGDVYVDGRVARKNLDQQHAMAITVHDDQFHAPRDRLPSCWQADGDSHWTTTEHGFAFNAEASEGLRQRDEAAEKVHAGVTREDRQGSATADTPTSTVARDWLFYRHLRLDRDGKTVESPVLDIYGYNQTLPILELHEVPHLALTFRLRADGSGAIFLRGLVDTHEFVCVLASDGRVQLFDNGNAVADGQLYGPLIGRSKTIDFSLIDQACLLSVDGQVIIDYPFDQPGGDGPTTGRPFGIACEGLSLTIAGVRVWRDVYYGESRPGAPIQPIRLGDNEYFVLSDNAPRGLDSRDSQFGPVPFKLFVGKPLLAVGAEGVRLWWFPAIQVPALRQIRYIR